MPVYAPTRVCIVLVNREFPHSSRTDCPFSCTHPWCGVNDSMLKRGAALAKAQKDPDKSNGCFCWRTHFNWHSKPKPITLDAELYFPDGSSCNTAMYYGQKWADVVSRFAYACLLSQCDWSIHDIKSLFLLCAVFRVGGISRGGFATSYLHRIHFRLVLHFAYLFYEGIWLDPLIRMHACFLDCCMCMCAMSCAIVIEY